MKRSVVGTSQTGIFAVLAVGLGGLAALSALDMARGVGGGGFAAVAFAAPPDDAPASAPKPSAGQEADGGYGDDDHGGGGDAAEMDMSGQEACPAVTLAERAGLSRAELSMLSSLAERRRELERRSAELDIRENTMAAAEARLETRVDEIKLVRAEVETLLGQLEGAQQAQVDELVALYETMKPEDAARILPGLDADIRLSVAAGLKDKTLASILGLMTQDEAIGLTMQLARRHGTSTDLDQPLMRNSEG